MHSGVTRNADIHGSDVVLYALLEVCVDLGFQKRQVPRHGVVYVGRRGDSVALEARDLHALEVGQERRVLEARDLGNDVGVHAHLLLHVNLVHGLDG